MQKNRQLCIGLSLATTWLAGNGWRRPDSRAEEICLTDFYVDYAKKAEAARLDFLFRPDALFLKPDMLDQSPGLAGLDPTLLLATLARETSRIGLVTTASTTFNHPYHVARALQSLHWISRGRAGLEHRDSSGWSREFWPRCDARGRRPLRPGDGIHPGGLRPVAQLSEAGEGGGPPVRPLCGPFADPAD